MGESNVRSHVNVSFGDARRSWMLGHLLRRCHQVNTAIWNSTVGSSLTAPQYAVLAVVAAIGESDMQTVGAIAALDKATMTGVVRRLEANGWIKRAAHPDDRRRRTLALTPAATMAVRHSAALLQAARDEFLEPVVVGDRDRLMRHLRELARVDEHPPPGIQIGAQWGRLIGTAGHLVRRAQQVHTAQWSAEFGTELTGPQFVVLRMLSTAGEIVQSRLGELVALDRATMSGVVERLVRRGLVVAVPDPSDRRSRLVGLTEAGATLLDAALPRAEAVQLQTVEPVAVSDRAWLSETLQRLAFRSAGPGGGEAACAGERDVFVASR